MQRCNKILFIISAVFILTASFFRINSFAEIIVDGEGKPKWNDPQAYRPYPVLFLHGFAAGDPKDWTTIVGLDSPLNGYFKNYYRGDDPDHNTVLPDTRSRYLEVISFIAPKNLHQGYEEFIDRNSSIDAYQKGDYYVAKKKRKDKDPGWADKLDIAVEEILAAYKSNKVILVAHSMGGLAAREYITDNQKFGLSYKKVPRLIMIGTPNLGAELATIATVATTLQKISRFIPGYGQTYLKFITTIDHSAKFAAKVDMKGDAVRDMTRTIINKGFIKTLNSRDRERHYTDVNYYAIYAIHPFLYGDAIVSIDSQKAKGVLDLSATAEITAWHGDEPGLAQKEILGFLDATRPEIAITSPDPAQTTEIHETSLSIKGEVRKEYLPENSLLTITITRQEDGQAVTPPAPSRLKPSRLWVANDPDSVVAEFDETVNLPGNGTYRIACYVTNPAEKISEIKDVWVKVSVPQEVGVIVHCHNPEGKEIASIQGMDPTAVSIYDGDTFIGYGASSLQLHNKPITILSGTHTIKAKFNGMNKEEIFTLNPSETKTITFIFERTEYDIAGLINSFGLNGSISVTSSDPRTVPGGGRGKEIIINDIFKLSAVLWDPGDYGIVSVSLNSNQYLFTVEGDMGYGGVGAVNGSWSQFNSPNLNINIGNNNFERWIIQSKISAIDGVTPASRCIINIIIDSQSVYLGRNLGCYCTFSPLLTVNSKIDTFALYIISARNNPVKEGASSIDKMSSVPYDLPETGF